MIALACYLSPCDALGLRCTGDPLDQGRPLHKGKSTVLDCVKSSELDKLHLETYDRITRLWKVLRENRRENRRSAKAGKRGS
jgi:hypothetical protein